MRFILVLLSEGKMQVSLPEQELVKHNADEDITPEIRRNRN